jgi:hypothetical protein
VANICEAGSQTIWQYKKNQFHNAQVVARKDVERVLGIASPICYYERTG